MTEFPYERNCVRRCNQCNGEMTFKKRAVEESSFPWRERGDLFACNNCQYETVIADPSTIITALLSAIVIFLVEGYALQNGLIDFVTHAWSSMSAFAALAIFIVVLFIFFFFGAMLNFIRGLQQLYQHLFHPILSGGEVVRKIFVLLLILILGILPWGIAIGMGMFNDEYLHAGEWFGLLMLPLIFSPIFLAVKLNVSPAAVFFASAFWLGLGLSIWIL